MTADQRLKKKKSKLPHNTALRDLDAFARVGGPREVLLCKTSRVQARFEHEGCWKYQGRLRISDGTLPWGTCFL